MRLFGGLVAAIRRMLNPAQYAMSQSLTLVRDRRGIHGLVSPEDHGALAEWVFECRGDVAGALAFCANRFPRFSHVVVVDKTSIENYFILPLTPSQLESLIEDMARSGLHPANMERILSIVMGKESSISYLDV